ncbi:MAG: flagellar type III secretion system pore protein FliP [Myxococcota bacterium]|nr:flagellar type III secretion system pore protein FliP [Myxococcota bacterium]
MTQAANLIENQSLAPSLKVLLLLTLLGLLPALILTATSFLRTVVVLSFLRIGMGTAQTPPNQVMIGIALFLTLFTMSPVISQIKDVAYEPYQRGEVTEIQAIERGIIPVKRFMLRQTREEDLRMFHAATNTPIPQTPDEVSITMALPAFAISELTTGFQMGVVILLPFLVVDLAVASLLMSMGMIMVPPATLSLPIKLLLFVLVDGWNLVTGSILRSFL